MKETKWIQIIPKTSHMEMVVGKQEVYELHMQKVQHHQSF